MTDLRIHKEGREGTKGRKDNESMMSSVDGKSGSKVNGLMFNHYVIFVHLNLIMKKKILVKEVLALEFRGIS